MAKTLDLRITRYQFEFGGFSINPMGPRVLLTAEHKGGSENFRVYFFEEPAGAFKLEGWRATDKALVAFFRRSDYAGFAFLLETAKATHLTVELDDQETMLSFLLTTDPSSAPAPPLQTMQTDWKAWSAP